MRRRALPVLFVLTVAAVLPVALSSPALAQQGGCVVNPVTLQCEINVPVEIPGDPGGGGGPVGEPNPGGGGGGGGPQAPPPPDPEAGGSAANNCTWQTVAGPAAEVYREQLGASADAVIQICAGGDGMGGPLYRQVPPGEEGAAAAPPDPATVAMTLLATAQGNMHAPAVHADPPLETPSIITLPVFVEVTNWVGAFDTEGCVGGVCVVLTATPTLTYEPGEPGSDPKVCTPPGTRFDPNGADPVIQAQVPGACAHVYETRTGAAGRPPTWPAQVTITWAIAWQATGAVEAGGTFPDESLSTDIPRAVDEVQTVVVDQGGR